MRKKAAGRLVFAAVLLAVLSAVAFSAPYPKTKKFWFAYLCGVLAVVYQIYVVAVCCSKKNNAGNRFCGFPVPRLGTYYLVMQVTASLLQLTLHDSISGWAMAAVNIPFLSFPIIGTITTQTVLAELDRQDRKPKNN